MKILLKPLEGKIFFSLVFAAAMAAGSFISAAPALAAAPAPVNLLSAGNFVVSSEVSGSLAGTVNSATTGSLSGTVASSTAGSLTGTVSSSTTGSLSGTVINGGGSCVSNCGGSSGGSSSGGSSYASSNGGGTIGTITPLGSVLGASISFPSNGLQYPGSVLGTNATLPRTGVPLDEILALLAISGTASIYILRKEKEKV
jgi:hypothetical protein